jgi:hypothetical protein
VVFGFDFKVFVHTVGNESVDRVEPYSDLRFVVEELVNGAAKTSDAH